MIGTEFILLGSRTQKSMEAAIENDGEPPDGKPSLNTDATITMNKYSRQEYKTLWRRQLGNKSTGGDRKRSQSLSTLKFDKYTAGEIRRMRERLLRTQRRPEAGAIKDFNRTQKLALASLALVDFTSFCSMSIMAPFFPREAAKKGMTETVSGLVFSFYALIMFLSSPIFGKILPHTGAKFLFMTGMFVAGGCNLLFGLLANIEDYYIFTAYCFAVRGMEALGASAYATASYVFVVEIFPDNIGTVLGILETFVGLGMSTGPAIGGLLYAAGGFSLPFYVLGIVMVAIVPVNLLLLPTSDGHTGRKKSGSILELIRIPSVIMVSLIIIVASNTWGFLDPTLEPHLREFNLSAEKVGLIFLMFSALYGIFSPIWGWLADKLNNHWSMMVWGLFVCTGGLLLLGPSPFLPFLQNTIWLNLIALSILGISVALTLLPTFQSLLESAIEGGCTEGLATYSMVAGIWSCMYSLGEVIGPLLGGVLLEHYGFPVCSTVMAGLTFTVGVIAMIFFTVTETCSLEKCEGSTDSGISEPANGSWDHDDSEAGSTAESYEREDSPLISNSAEHDLYTREKVQYYEQTSHPERRAIGELRIQVAITAGGACEV